MAKPRRATYSKIHPVKSPGIRKTTPLDCATYDRPPTNNDFYNHQIFDEWIDGSSTLPYDVWKLVAKIQGVATWVNLLGGQVETLTGDTGGAVSPDAADNINLLGTVGEIITTGTPGTNTITWSLDGTIAASYLTDDANSAIPALGVLTVAGTGGLTTSSAGSTVTVTSDGTVATSYLTDDTNSAIPALGVLTVAGTGGLETSSAGSTVTVTSDGTVATSYLADDANSAIPAAGVLTVTGAHGLNTSAGASTLTVAIDNAITLGDLAAIGAGANALSCTTGDVNLTAGNIKIADTNAAGSEGIISLGGNRWIHNFGSTGATPNTFVGEGSGNLTLTGISNTGIGGNALSSATTAQNCTAIGKSALENCTTSNGNTAVGLSALATLTTGNGVNTAVGFFAGINVTTAENNTFFGYQSAVACTTGNNNLAVGTNALSTITTGAGNIAVGVNSGTVTTTSDAGNIIIGSQGVAGQDNAIHIGANSGTLPNQTKCWIAGIRGITTDVADAIAVLIDSTGQLGTASSSIRFKENVKDMADDSSAIYDLRPVTFNYISNPHKTKQYGLIAEEVHETFPSLVVRDKDGEIESVKYMDLITLTLNEIKKLRNRVEELEKKVI